MHVDLHFTSEASYHVHNVPVVYFVETFIVHVENQSR